MTLTRSASTSAEPSESPEGHLPPGTMVAERYRIERSLGEGGMGAVYLAEHVAMRKAVALKVLHADSSRNPEIVQRFEREAVAAASIDHQNVASATDFGALPDGSFFLVLEYVSGRSLRDELAGGALAPVRALGIMRGIVAGLAAAHVRGIVHRDLKPENVMLTEREGNPDFVKVLDFGIAKIGMEAEASGASSRPLTRVGTIMGTPNYMSPEQAIGQPCDARADIYALGVVFYEMLVGEPLFEGDPVVVLAAHVTSPPPPLPAPVQEALGPHGEEVFQKLLAKSPDERYQTAGELSSALEQLGTQLSPLPPMSSPSASRIVVGAPTFSATGPISIASTGAAATPAVVSAPTQMAMAAGPEPHAASAPQPSLLAADTPPAAPESKSRRMVLGACLAAAATGAVVLLAFALGGPSTDEPEQLHPASSASAAVSADPEEQALPPLPSAQPEAKSGSSGASAAPSGGKSGSAKQSGGGNNGKKGGRKTGPGGIYIPPPNKWLP